MSSRLTSGPWMVSYQVLEVDHLRAVGAQALGKGVVLACAHLQVGMSLPKSRRSRYSGISFSSSAPAGGASPSAAARSLTCCAVRSESRFQNSIAIVHHSFFGP